MSLLDEFEVEPTVAYSGSYTDAVMSGTLGMGNGRVLIALNSTGSNLLSLVSQTGEVINYSTYAEHQRRSIAGYNRFAQFFCPNETFYDSLVPDPLDIYTGKYLFAFLDNAVPWSLSGNGKIQLGYQDVYNTSSVVAPTGTVVTDRDWLQSFPFQGRYSSLRRLQEFKDLQILTAYDEKLSGSGLSYEFDPQTILSNRGQFTIEFLALSSSNGKVPKWTGTAYGTDYGVAAITNLEIKGTVSASNLNFNPTAYNAPTNVQLFKAFYGIGDGFRGQPEFDRVLTNVSGAFSSGSFSYHKAQGLILRGFKYGLYSAVPVTSKMVWRKTRYGQFRDRLEQRQFSKFFDLKGFTPDGRNIAKRGVGEAVVTIRFVSGSQASITASNPLTLNERDSGIYDYEYKAGRPFFDDN